VWPYEKGKSRGSTTMRVLIATFQIKTRCQEKAWETLLPLLSSGNHSTRENGCARERKAGMNYCVWTFIK
jgi:hypothetical protein